MILYGEGFLGAWYRVCAMFVRAVEREIAVSWTD